MEVKGIPKIKQKEFLASRFTKLNFWPLAVGAIDAKKVLKKSKLSNNCLITVQLLIVIVF